MTEKNMAVRVAVRAVVHDATAGALEALGVMTTFVIIGLGWAMIAGASPYDGGRDRRDYDARSECSLDSRHDGADPREESRTEATFVDGTGCR